VNTGLAYTPDEYRAMTRGERDALIREANRAARKTRRR
jgi:hypothetical protein